MKFHEIVHAREHYGMGCGPADCPLCKCSGMAASPDTLPDSQAPLITRRDVEKYIILGIIGSIVGGVVTELVVRRMIFGGKKNPSGAVKTKADEAKWRRAVRSTRRKFKLRRNQKLEAKHYRYAMGAYKKMKHI